MLTAVLCYATIHPNSECLRIDPYSRGEDYNVGDLQPTMIIIAMTTMTKPLTLLGQDTDK